MVKIEQVEVNENYVRGARYQREQINSVRLYVETELAKFDIVLDDTGVDVVSDQPASFTGAAISWEQLHGLVQGDMEIRSAQEKFHIEELEMENERLKTHICSLTEEVDAAEYEHAGLMERPL